VSAPARPGLRALGAQRIDAYLIPPNTSNCLEGPNRSGLMGGTRYVRL